MTATERLRAMLDEQGVERYEHEAPATDCVAFFDGRGWHDCWESVDGEVNVTFSMTPEQAIAATLGSGTCHEVEDEDTGFIVCSECGAVHDENYTSYYCWCCGRKVICE